MRDKKKPGDPVEEERQILEYQIIRFDIRGRPHYKKGFFAWIHNVVLYNKS